MKQVIICLCALLLATGLATGLSLDSYGDSFISSQSSCQTTGKGRTITSSPCYVHSVTGHTQYDLLTTSGKLAIAMPYKVHMTAQEVYNGERSRTIPTINGVREESIILPSFKTVKIDADALTCDFGTGSTKKQVTFTYENNSKSTVNVCYNAFNTTHFIHNVLDIVPAISKIPIIRERPITIQPVGSYSNSIIYDLGVSHADVHIDWGYVPFTGKDHISKEFFVIAYDEDPMGELEEGLATVLDPFWNSSWNARQIIEITCPGSGEISNYTSCRKNDTVIINLNMSAMANVQADGDDVRIIYRNDSPTDSDQIELTYVNLTGWSATSRTKIMFSLMNDTATNTSDYYVYWNNPLATAPTRTASGMMQDPRTWGMDRWMWAYYSFKNFSGVGHKQKSEVQYGAWKTGTDERLIPGAGADVGTAVDRIGGTNHSVPGMASRFGDSYESCGVNDNCGMIIENGNLMNRVVSNFTMTWWVYTNTTAPIGNNDFMVEVWGAGASTKWKVGENGQSANTVVEAYCNPSGGGGAWIYDTKQIPLNQWNFYALVYNNTGGGAGGCQLWINDERVAQDPNNGGTYTVNDDLCVMRGCNAGSNWPGFMNDLAFYNISMTNTQIRQLYNWTRPIGQPTNITFTTTGVGTLAPTVQIETETVYPNGTGHSLNHTVPQVEINITYQSAQPENGSIITAWYINNTPLFNISFNATANSTHQVNLSNAYFDRNSTIYVMAMTNDTLKKESSWSTTENVTVTNVPPGQPNISVSANFFNGMRTRENVTLTFNTFDSEGDSLYHTLTLNGTLYCGLHNISNQCNASSIPEGRVTGSVSLWDQENNTNRTDFFDIVIDEHAPGLDNIVNSSITDTTIPLSFTTDEPCNYTISYGVSAGALTNKVVSTSFTTAHTPTIPGLTAGTIYYYQITVGDNVTSPYGDWINTSIIYNASTLGASSPPLNVTIIGGGGGGGGTGVDITTIEGEFELIPATVGKFVIVTPNDVDAEFETILSTNIAAESCTSEHGIFTCEIVSGGVRVYNDFIEDLENSLVVQKEDTILVTVGNAQDSSQVTATFINMKAYIPIGLSFIPSVLRSPLVFETSGGNVRGIRTIAIIVVILGGMLAVYMGRRKQQSRKSIIQETLSFRR